MSTFLGVRFHWCLGLGVLLWTACGTADRPALPAETSATPLVGSPASVTVRMAQMQFRPDTVRVHAGDTLIFTNADVVEHDATALPDSAWTTGRLQPGETAKVVAQAGAEYFCSIHVVMRGVVLVD